MALHYFSQRDPRWAKTKLGRGPLTLGSSGCLVSSAAALLATWGVDTDPLRLNAYLLAHGGFASADLFVYAAINGLNCRFKELIRCATVAAPVARLRAELDAGAGALVCVDWQPGTAVFQQHWVLLTALGVNSGHIADPWQMPGYELRDLGLYLKTNWTAARGIFAIALYEQETTPTRAAQRAATAHQQTACFIGGN